MNAEEIHEKLVELLADLVEANRTAPVIVEGERDEKALREVGLTGEIVRLNSGIPVFNLAEGIARRHREAVILTDWDHRGGRLCQLLREAFEANQVRFDIDLRARMTTLCRKDIKDVESLPGYVERLSRQVEGGWQGKESKRFYAERKSTAVQERKARRIKGKKG
jgi:5S rRNA maturation endonuclease (ribonuclease M5)